MTQHGVGALQVPEVAPVEALLQGALKVCVKVHAGDGEADGLVEVLLSQWSPPACADADRSGTSRPGNGCRGRSLGRARTFQRSGWDDDGAAQSGTVTKPCAQRSGDRWTADDPRRAAGGGGMWPEPLAIGKIPGRIRSRGHALTKRKGFLILKTGQNRFLSPAPISPKAL